MLDAASAERASVTSKLASVPRELPPSGTIASRARFFKARARGLAVLPLVGAPRGLPPRHVIEAIQQAASQHLVCPSNGLPELRKAIAQKLLKENGIVADPEA